MDNGARQGSILNPLLFNHIFSKVVPPCFLMMAPYGATVEIRITFIGSFSRCDVKNINGTFENVVSVIQSLV